MTEVAKKAGVSQPTVSRVINNDPSVNPEIRQRVMKWVRKLDYQPNRAAQLLVKKQSFLLGMVIPDVTNPYFSEVLRSVEHTADLNGYSIVLCYSRGHLQKEKQCMNILRRHQVAGALLVPVDREMSRANIPKHHQMPVVSITADMPSLDSVCVAHRRGGMLVANHFLELGHTNMAYIGTSCDEKFQGFRETLQSRGISLDDDNVIALDTFWGKDIFNGVHKQLSSYLRKKGRVDVTALFACNDISAFIAIRILREHGYAVPDDIAVAGFDNTFLAQEMQPQLTSVAQPIAEIGRLAVETLLERFSTQDVEQRVHIELEPTLVERGSTNKGVPLRSATHTFYDPHVRRVSGKVLR